MSTTYIQENGCHQKVAKFNRNRDSGRQYNNTNNNNANANNNNNNRLVCLKPDKFSKQNKTKEKQIDENNCSKPANATNTNRKAAGCNWKSHKENKANSSVNLRNGSKSTTNGTQQIRPPSDCHKNYEKQPSNEMSSNGRYIAMDCEMVGYGANGKQSMVARVTLVDQQCNVLLDKYVKPEEVVTDYRTSISGIRPQDIIDGEDFKQVQKEVLALIKGKYLVGHNVSKDLAVLHIRHPRTYIRDTSTYMPLRQLLGCNRTPSLKLLSSKILGLEIQVKEHNPIEDAQAAMRLYNRLSKEWERYIRKRHKLHN